MNLEQLPLIMKAFQALFRRRLHYISALFILLLSVPVLHHTGAHAAQATLAWDDDNETDMVAGYRAYCGDSSGNYQVVHEVQDQTRCNFTNLEEGEIYYFAVKAYGHNGAESDFSDELAYSVPISQTDSDGDGIIDFDETNIYGTDPAVADTDHDGINDGQELAFWGDAWDQDADHDSVINLLDSDSDGDTFSDGEEVSAGSDPGDRNSNPGGPDTNPGPDGSGVIKIEAEDGFLASPMQIVQDSEASGSEYIEIPSGFGKSNDPSENSGYAEYTFDVPEDGDYVIWGKVLAPDAGSDSFFVSVDNGDYLTWHVMDAKAWAWDVVSEREVSDTRDASNPRMYFLSEGEHVLIVKFREDATKLDQIIISNNSAYVPGQSDEPSDDTDTDGDGITDSNETNLYGTDPAVADTDHDGINDGQELALWGDAWGQDVDHDSVINLLDYDSDGDTFSDGEEVSAGSDPGDQDSNPGDQEPDPGPGEPGKILIEAEDGFLSSPMQISQDNDASGNEYVSVPAGTRKSNNRSTNSGYAEYTFDVSASGDYMIWCRVLASDSGSDSFYIQIDNGDYTTWHIVDSITWKWDVVSDRKVSDARDYSNPMTFYLDKGEHTLIIKHREDGTYLDRILITNDPDYIPDDSDLTDDSTTPDTGSLSIEAEKADNMVSPMQTAGDGNASGGQYLYVSNGAGSYWSPGAVMASYGIDIAREGDYVLWGKVIAANGDDNSFYVQIDNGQDNLWEISWGYTWHWDAVNDRNGDDPILIHLAAGHHTLKIKAREDGTMLDKLLLTDDLQYVPNDSE